MTHPNVFLTIQGQMIPILTDHDLCEQTGTRNAAGNGSLGWGRAADAIFAVTAGILGTHQLVELQSGGNVFQALADVLANAIFGSLTACAHLLMVGMSSSCR